MGTVTTERQHSWVCQVAALVAIAPTALLRGCTSASSGDKASSGDSSNTSASSLDNWLRAACKPGTFADRHALPGAVSGGLCQSPQQELLYVLKYTSAHAAENDLSMIGKGHYYAEKSADGALWIFLAVGTNMSATSVQPLTQYGFDIKKVRQQ